MQAHRFRAPKQDGSIFSEPILDNAPLVLASNAKRLAGWNYDFQGRQFSVLREKVRDDVFAAARLYHEAAGLDIPATPLLDAPMVVTGHQPELFHPGVWIKNFAVAGIARASGASALNLIVDNDVPKGASIRVPHRTPRGIRTQVVPFDSWSGERPFEDQSIADRSLFDSFPHRVRQVLSDQVPNPLVDRFWGYVTSAPDGMQVVGQRFARARRLIEAEWGVKNWEIPLSSLCETEGFLWYASHLLAHLPRFQAVHNDALDRYRSLYHIRSKNHPVAALGGEGDWLEAPFWVWRKSEPRRRALLVRQVGKSMELRMGGEPSPFLKMPLAADRDACCAVEALRELPGQGIRLRTRALTTTMFARFLVGDLFVHGIGGAKYDELGDEVARDFFGIEPPDFLTLSMTLHLGLPTSSANLDDLHAIDRRIRDLAWQPERFLGDDFSIRKLLDQKQTLIDREPSIKGERRSRYESLRDVNRSLASLVEGKIPPAVDERESLLKALRDDSVARSREYSLVLHDEGRIREAMAPVVTVVRT